MPKIKDGRKAAAVGAGVTGAGLITYGVIRLSKKKKEIEKVSLYGKVVDEETQEPLAGVRVKALTVVQFAEWEPMKDEPEEAWRWEDYATATTDENGDYELKLAPGKGAWSESGKPYSISFNKACWFGCSETVWIKDDEETRELNASLEHMPRPVLTMDIEWLVDDEWVPNFPPVALLPKRTYRASVFLQEAAPGEGGYCPGTYKVEMFVGGTYWGGWIDTAGSFRKSFIMPDLPGTYRVSAKVYDSETGELLHPPDFDLSSIVIIGAKAEVELWWKDEQPFEPGSTHTLHVKIANPTGSDWTYSVGISLDNVPKIWDKVDIDAGDDTELEYDLRMPELPTGVEQLQSTIQVGVSSIGYSQAFTIQADIFSPSPEAEASCVWDEMPPEFQPGSEHDATITITNPTDYEWEFRAELVLAGERVSVWDLDTLEPHEKTEWDVDDVPMPDIPGTWNVDVIIYDAETGARVAHIRCDPVTVLEVGPPPPAGMLSVLDIIKVLEYARCSHHLDPNIDPAKLGLACRPHSATPGVIDPRITLGRNLQAQCVEEVVNSVYAAPPSWAEAFLAHWSQYSFWVKEALIRRLTYYGYVPELSAGAAVMYLYLKKALELGMGTEACEAYLASLPGGLGDGVRAYALIALISEQIDQCCTRKVQEYWDKLSEQAKYDNWLKPRYLECATADRTMNQLYAAQWAPCTPEELMPKASRLGNFNEEAAWWAVEHLAEYPWVR